ncbi:unnamed protein product [Allacma fusca]|uniref:alpha-mannosidase n=1 Tax=Allacma fusca TaxID=39272 RepID=A0A8J2KC86_9HEXA|nr:unnamed protein product [Allacma fusca]
MDLLDSWYLNDTFGKCALPRVAWQIDPFGHSREQASLFANMGFDGLFFGRLDYQDKFYRRVGKNMETIWSGSPNNLGKDSWLFSGALFNGYNPPDGYCFDIFCGDDPINDDPKLLGYNLDKKVEDFIRIAQYWATPYRTKNVLMTMGSDFQYMAAYTWYKNLDKLIKHVNARQSNGSTVNLFYSTPSCYLQEVNKANLSWSMKTDDYFPYASDPHAFWTGYFTSRPTLKYFIHKTNNFLQTCQQLSSMTDENGETLDGVFKLAEPVAVNQHHDAVAGTAKQHVTNDYALRISIGIQSCEKVISSALSKIQGTQGASESPSSNRIDDESLNNSSRVPNDFQGFQYRDDEYEFCHLLNISACDPSELKSSLVVSVYNPLARQVVNSYVRLPVSTPVWHVEGPHGDVSTQAIPLPEPVLDIPGRISAAQYELIFPAGVLSGLTVTNFKLTRVIDNEIVRGKFQPIIQNWEAAIDVPVVLSVENSRRRFLPKMSLSPPNEDFSIENSVGLTCEFDGTTGLIQKIRRGNSEIQLSQNFYYYHGMKGNNSDFDSRASGAYIFRPNGTSPIPIAQKVKYEVYKGEHVTEVRQVFSEWVSQVIRLYDKADAVEFEWLVGPIPVGDHIGKEVVTRYSTDLSTNGTFYTDSNGREMLRRKRNKRPTWNYKVYEPVAGNYYPVNSRMIITEEEKQNKKRKTLILLNDRAQGGTSINDGELEVMIHRRLLFDDAFGVGEALNEEAYGTGLVTRGKHWIVFAGDTTGVPASIHRPLAQEIFMDRILAFRDSTPADEIYLSGANVHTSETLYSKLSRVLPPNCHLLTLKKLAVNEYLIRFEHIYEKNEDKDLSTGIVISVQELEEVLKFKSIRETTLGGNQWKDEAKRFQWKVVGAQEGLSEERKATQTVDDSASTNTYHTLEESAAKTITLSPMQIRTFIFTT